jgi:predicted PurR-regulated permease PerM
VPEYSAHLQQTLSHFATEPPAFLHKILPWPEGESAQTAFADNPDLAAASHWLTGSLPRIGSWALGQLLLVLSGFGLLAGLALVPVYTFYFLLEQRQISGQWTRYIPMPDPALREEIVFILDSVRRYLVAYFRGQVLVALCDAVLYTVGFYSVGLNYALLIGFAALFLTMIPFLGAMVVVITALALALAQYLDWQHPALVLGVFALVQTLEGVFISPKIIGDRVGLHPLVIIVAVMTGTTLLGGLLGGILAIPLAAALRVILGRYLWRQGAGA